jgi:hypothetical protein
MTAYVGWYAGDENTLLAHSAPHRKTPAERRKFYMDFGSTGELLDGDTIDSGVTPTVVAAPATSPALTVGAVNIASGNAGRVEVWLSGGTDKQDYNITFTITTTAGAIIARTGRLIVDSGN